MRRARAAALVIVIALAAWVVTAEAAPRGDTDDPGARVHLALGDSVAAGVGAQPGATGYPQRLGALLGGSAGDVEVVSLAVPGATTGTLADTQLPAALRLLEERGADVAVVTVTVGGNDAFGPTVGACITSTTTGCQATVDAVLRDTGARLTEVLGQLVGAADEDAEVVVTTYDNPLGSCHLGRQDSAAVPVAETALEGGSVPGVLALDAGLNDVIRSAAAATGARVADLHGALGPTRHVGGQDCLHPNAAGHAVIADTVRSVLRR